MFSAWNEIQRRVPFKALILLFNTFKIDQGDILKAKFIEILPHHHNSEFTLFSNTARGPQMEGIFWLRIKLKWLFILLLKTLEIYE